jgi:hypothetical protein
MPFSDVWARIGHQTYEASVGGAMFTIWSVLDVHDYHAGGKANAAARGLRSRRIRSTSGTRPVIAAAISAS